mmetsp:Transcript_14941/g.22615  ORF Transcript_14941/g.22615 Transcript_14941/m.22615 type:complete len:86 (+) Transcript_14941:1742-1999(+)
MMMMLQRCPRLHRTHNKIQASPVLASVLPSVSRNSYNAVAKKIDMMYVGSFIERLQVVGNIFQGCLMDLETCKENMRRVEHNKPS